MTGEALVASKRASRLTASLAAAATLLLASCATAPDSVAEAVQARQASATYPPTAWAQSCEDWDEWNKPGPPFALSGSDTYYVGTCGITAVLIDSGDGLILIDSGTNEGADVVLANIAALGFNPADVKLILTSHEHFDHVGGVAKIRQATGARLVTSAAAAEVFTSGEVSPDDPQYGMIEGVKAARVDRIVADGDVVALGNKRLVAIATPGHTHGALSWKWNSIIGPDTEIGIVYADSLSPVSADNYRFSDHAQFLAAYRESLGKISSEGRCLLVTPHPSASQMRDRLTAWGLAMAGRSDCADYAASITQRLDARLAKEQSPQS